MPQKKRFRKYDPSGLGINGGGELCVPHRFTEGEMPEGLNNYGFPFAEVGDYVVASLPDDILTAETVGRVARILCGAQPGGAVEIELPDRKPLKTWRYGAYVLSMGQTRNFLKTLSAEQISSAWAQQLLQPSLRPMEF